MKKLSSKNYCLSMSVHDTVRGVESRCGPRCFRPRRGHRARNLHFWDKIVQFLHLWAIFSKADDDSESNISGSAISLCSAIAESLLTVCSFTVMK